MNLPSENSYKDIFLPYVGYREGINGLFGTENGDFRSYRYGYELTIGTIHDRDIIYINGEKLGTTLGWHDQRVYEVPKEILYEGANIIAIMHCDYWGESSVDGPRYLENTKGDKIFLEGSWLGLFLRRPP